MPDAYKDIETVMDAQADLVRKVAKVEPRIVLMAGKPGLVYPGLFTDTACSTGILPVLPGHRLEACATSAYE